MGFYKYMEEAFRKRYAARSPEYKKRIAEWNRGPPIVRVEKPLNIARARELGYKAKKGFVVVRVRVPKGLRKREKPRKGRKPSKYGRFFSPKLSHQAIAEQRAARGYRNLEVLNSYWVGGDGSNDYFEVILADPRATGIPLQKGRAFRGLTAAGRKARGLP